MQNLSSGVRDAALMLSVKTHQGMRRGVARLARAGVDRGASHGTEVAGAVVLVGGVWVAIDALGLDDAISQAIDGGVGDATGGGE